MPGRHQAAVLARAKRSPRRMVMPADWRERRALQRMEAYGAALPATGLPGVWIVSTEHERLSS